MENSMPSRFRTVYLFLSYFLDQRLNGHIEEDHGNANGKQILDLLILSAIRVSFGCFTCNQ